jgi:hypothetical protein
MSVVVVSEGIGREVWADLAVNAMRGIMHRMMPGTRCPAAASHTGSLLGSLVQVHASGHIALAIGPILLGQLQLPSGRAGRKPIEMPRLVTIGEGHSLRGTMPRRRLARPCSGRTNLARAWPETLLLPLLKISLGTLFGTPLRTLSTNGPRLGTRAALRRANVGARGRSPVARWFLS